MYFPRKTDRKSFIDAIIAGTALPTGSESPFRLNDTIKSDLLAAGEKGLSAKLVSISSTVSGGDWRKDNDPSQTGYIGNFSCKLQIGTQTTFANLDVATVVRFQLDGGSTAVHIVQTPNAKDSTKPYFNVKAVKGLVLDVKDAAQLAALQSIKDFAEVAAPTP